MPTFEEINQAINNSKILSTKDKEFFLLYNEFMNAPEDIKKKCSPRKSYQFSLSVIQKFEESNFNKIISDLEAEIRDELKVNPKEAAFPHLDTLRAFSFEIQKYSGWDKAIDNVIKKIKVAKSLLAEGQQLEMHEKLTLAELGLVAKFRKFKYCMGDLRHHNINLEISKKYLKLAKQCSKIVDLDDAFLERTIQERFNPERYLSGSVLVNDLHKHEAFQLKNTSSKIENLGPYRHYTHSAQLIRPADKVKQSHLWHVHQIEDVTVKLILTSDVFRFNILKLVEPTQEEKLAAVLGENWREKLQKLYSDKLHEVTSDELLKKISIINAASQHLLNDPDWISKNKYFGLFVQNPAGEKTVYKDVLVCSDYTAREIYQSYELVVQELEQLGITEAIRSPLPKHTDLNKVWPAELMELLNESGCLDEKVEQPEIDAIINSQNDFNLLLDHQVELASELHQKVLKLKQENQTCEAFVKASKIAFKAYLEANDLCNFDSSSEENKPEISKFLDENLTKFYQSIHSKKSSNAFVHAFLTLIHKLMVFIGFKHEDGKQIIEYTINELKKKHSPDIEQIPLNIVHVVEDELVELKEHIGKMRAALTEDSSPKTKKMAESLTQLHDTILEAVAVYVQSYQQSELKFQNVAKSDTDNSAKSQLTQDLILHTLTFAKSCESAFKDLEKSLPSIKSPRLLAIRERIDALFNALKNLCQGKDNAKSQYDSKNAFFSRHVSSSARNLIKKAKKMVEQHADYQAKQQLFKPPAANQPKADDAPQVSKGSTA